MTNESSDMVRQQELLDGTHVSQIVLNGVAAVNALQTIVPSITRAAGDLHAPYLARASMGLERKISTKTFLSLEYTHSSGKHLFRSRDINAPLHGLRADPRFLNIYQFESSGSSQANSVNVMLRSSFKRFELMAQYTFSKAMDEGANAFAPPSNAFDLRSEWARSDFDRRHRLISPASCACPASSS
jgi:hypothetical protein